MIVAKDGLGDEGYEAGEDGGGDESSDTKIFLLTMMHPKSTYFFFFFSLVEQNSQLCFVSSNGCNDTAALSKSCRFQLRSTRIGSFTKLTS
ncbi:hypothetical protein TIFTF001_039373 [Ficus carica]|uniref:Uncharacterized protein n=1 Tax=Ficus carica TaxID=3494 RepID=A0AA88E9R4_FICCA|nr:hypothetical protein TIFTF001_039373 [Ficus carica]